MWSRSIESNSFWCRKSTGTGWYRVKIPSWMISWVVPLPSNSHHQHYYVLRKGSLSFATVTGRGDNRNDIQQTHFMIKNPWLVDFSHPRLFCQICQVSSEDLDSSRLQMALWRHLDPNKAGGQLPGHLPRQDANYKPRKTPLAPARKPMMKPGEDDDAFLQIGALCKKNHRGNTRGS